MTAAPLSRPGHRTVFKRQSRLFAGFNRLKLWHRRHRTRLHLADANPQMLRDVGLTAAARNDEIKKWFWQP